MGIEQFLLLGCCPLKVSQTFSILSNIHCHYYVFMYFYVLPSHFYQVH